MGKLKTERECDFSKATQDLTPKGTSMEIPKFLVHFLITAVKGLPDVKTQNYTQSTVVMLLYIGFLIDGI